MKPAGAESPGPIRAFLDRIEGETAVLLLDNEEVIYLPARLLPAGAREGCWLEVRLPLRPPVGTPGENPPPT